MTMLLQHRVFERVWCSTARGPTHCWRDGRVHNIYHAFAASWHVYYDIRDRVRERLEIVT